MGRAFWFAVSRHHDHCLVNAEATDSCCGGVHTPPTSHWLSSAAPLAVFFLLAWWAVFPCGRDSAGVGIASSHGLKRGMCGGDRCSTTVQSKAVHGGDERRRVYHYVSNRQRPAMTTDVQVPLIGVGGIGTGKDAYEKIRAGASLVQVLYGCSVSRLSVDSHVRVVGCAFCLTFFASRVFFFLVLFGCLFCAVLSLPRPTVCETQVALSLGVRMVHVVHFATFGLWYECESLPCGYRRRR